ncbi:hypothetical protein G5C66_03740 [Nocardioides sp. KC13]|uniref:Uncharacterized protein n=2 Tax=Nocardioides turkmenicus TaxID=2711220 RepID=A0A6M1R291_9ACTN|nr:hypothetical protein [Nocardioides sp. KC13]
MRLRASVSVTMESVSSAEPTYYRLAPTVQARLLGAAVVGLALLVFAGTAVVIAARIDFAWIFIPLVVGVIAVIGFGWWLRNKAYVLRASAQGYKIALVRGAGVREARWADIQEAVTTMPAGSPCLELRLKKGGATTIPVSILAIDREQFVRDLQAHLKATIKPLDQASGTTEAP